MDDNPALPSYLLQLLRQQYAPEDVDRIVLGSAAKRATTLRANTLKADRPTVAAALDDAGIPWQTVSWYPDAFRLPPASEAAVRALDVYARGEVYVQSLSSMVPAIVLDVRAGHDVCDMCAAPGGKTTQIVALSGAGAYVTACELHVPRAEKLQHNLDKLGATNVVVMRMDARRLDDFFSFDRVLVDAPCSGSGTLRASDARGLARFTPALVSKSCKAQAALLEKALKVVKPGGVVVYSTCSVLACENEDIVSSALRGRSKRGVFELVDAGIPGADDLPRLPTKLEGTMCLAPDDDYEGFFVAKIKRLA